MGQASSSDQFITDSKQSGQIMPQELSHTGKQQLQNSMPFNAQSSQFNRGALTRAEDATGRGQTAAVQGEQMPLVSINIVRMSWFSNLFFPYRQSELWHARARLMV